jgi:hypothetical protein
MMTYDKYTSAELKTAIDAIEFFGFLGGDGFDKVMKPANLLDVIMTNAGFTVVERKTEGGGQYKTVKTACGVTVYRNGYCHKDHVEAV